MISTLSAWGAQEWAAVSNVLVAAVAAIIALFSPMIAWRLTRRSQVEDQRRHTKITIFATLMENRHTPETRSSIGALNLIDVAYHDSPNIRRIWREYHSMICNPSYFDGKLGTHLRIQKFNELQAAMAMELSFSVDRFDVERVYQPNWIAEEEEIRVRERNARLAVLRQQPSSASIVPTSSGSTASAEGIYSIQYWGRSGAKGFGIVAFSKGQIVGNSIAGDKLCGTYTIAVGTISAEIQMSSSAGSTLVTGQRIDADTTLPITAQLTLPLEQNSHEILVNGEPVKLHFARLS